MLKTLESVTEFKSADIRKESKSRAGKSEMDYHLDSPTGVIRGKTNRLKLTVPQILAIAERLDNGETLSKIHKDYVDVISITSLNETMKKYYVGLFNRVIRQYRQLKEAGII